VDAGEPIVHGFLDVGGACADDVAEAVGGGGWQTLASSMLLPLLVLLFVRLPNARTRWI